MNTLFADTAYYLALLLPNDTAHGKAIEIALSLDARIVTTAWVLTELANSLRLPDHRNHFVRFEKALRGDPSVVIIDPSRELYDRGVALYGDRADKEWSLTDCISFIVMNERGITEALTTDRHFRQAGFQAMML